MALRFSSELNLAIEKNIATQQEHARAIGELCIAWAALDHAVDQMLEPLLNCGRDIVACISSSMDRTGPRLEIAKRLVVHLNLDDTWQGWLTDIFSRITEELGPLRNRYVHDRWRMKRGEMWRIDSRAQVKKPQANQPKQLFFDSGEVTPVTEVDRLRANIETVTYAIEIATFDLRNWRKTGQLRPLRQQLVPASTRRSRMDHFPLMIIWDGEQLPAYNYEVDL